MRLTQAEAWERVIGASHGALGTMHPDRGVDLVPVVYAVDADQTIFIPIDTVKEKGSTRLQRTENLRYDPRCTLLVDDYDDDWSRLWWVRINGEGREATIEDLQRFFPLLADRYRQYADPVVIAGGIVVSPRQVTGWTAS
jgi:PPOX class probable F420-dependent enzyme